MINAFIWNYRLIYFIVVDVYIHVIVSFEDNSAALMRLYIILFYCFDGNILYF